MNGPAATPYQRHEHTASTDSDETTYVFWLPNRDFPRFLLEKPIAGPSIRPDAHAGAIGLASWRGHIG